MNINQNPAFGNLPLNTLLDVVSNLSVILNCHVTSVTDQDIEWGEVDVSLSTLGDAVSIEVGVESDLSRMQELALDGVASKYGVGVSIHSNGEEYNHEVEELDEDDMWEDGDEDDDQDDHTFGQGR